MTVYSRKWMLFLLLTIFLVPGCDEGNPVNEGLTDAQKFQALKNVSWDPPDTLQFNLNLPAGFDSVSSFSDLDAEDSAVFHDLSKYSIVIASRFTADNSSTDAENTKFDGMTTEVVFGGIQNAPFDLVTEGRDIPKDSIVILPIEGELVLSTHKAAGKYVFSRMAAGDDIKAELTLSLNYKFGKLAGSYSPPPGTFSQNIPTRANSRTKAFLQGLLDSGILD